MGSRVDRESSNEEFVNGCEPSAPALMQNGAAFCDQSDQSQDSLPSNQDEHKDDILGILLYDPGDDDSSDSSDGDDCDTDTNDNGDDDIACNGLEVKECDNTEYVQNDLDDECPICFEKFNNHIHGDRAAFILPCFYRHVICRGCIVQLKIVHTMPPDDICLYQNLHECSTRTHIQCPFDRLHLHLPSGDIDGLKAFEETKVSLENLRETRTEIRLIVETKRWELREALLKVSSSGEETTRVLSEHHKNCAISRTIGASAGLVGSLLGISGVILMPFTFGTSIALTIGGIAVGATGSAVSGGASIAQLMINKNKMKEIEKLLNDCRTCQLHIRALLTQLGLYDSAIDENTRCLRCAEGDGKPTAAGLKRSLGGDATAIAGVARLPVGMIDMVANIAMTTMTTSGAIAGRTAAQVLGVATGIVTLPLDIGALIVNAYDIHKNRQSELIERLAEQMVEYRDNVAQFLDQTDQLLKASDELFRSLEDANIAGK